MICASSAGNTRRWSVLVGAKGGGRRMRGNWGMNFWKVTVYARCAGSLQVGLLKRKVHAATARQMALQHWDFGTPRISFSSHIQTKGFQQRPPPEKFSQTCLLPDKAGCVTVLATFLQLSKMHFLGGVNTYGVAGISVGGGGTYG